MLVWRVLKDSLVTWVLRATRAYLVLQPIQVQRGLRGRKVLQERQCRPVLRAGRVRLGLQARRVQQGQLDPRVRQEILGLQGQLA